MKTVTIQAAKAQPSRLLEEAHAGEEILILKGKKPMARLVPLAEGAENRRIFGAMRGRGPTHHAGPCAACRQFDRMLIAQALEENLGLVSNESVFDGFGVKRVW